MFEMTRHVISDMPTIDRPTLNMFKCKLYGWCRMPKEGLESLASDHKELRG